jgi:hypothetical protein
VPLKCFTKALELARPETTSARPNEQALYSTADSYVHLAEIEAALATNRRLPKTEQAANWMRAISLAEESLKTWSRIKEPDVQSPDGFDCVPTRPQPIGSLAEKSSPVHSKN